MDKITKVSTNVSFRPKLLVVVLLIFLIFGYLTIPEYYFFIKYKFSDSLTKFIDKALFYFMLIFILELVSIGIYTIVSAIKRYKLSPRAFSIIYPIGVILASPLVFSFGRYPHSTSPVQFFILLFVMVLASFVVSLKFQE